MSAVTHGRWKVATALIKRKPLSLEMSLKIEQRLEKLVELRGFEPLTFCIAMRSDFV
jgi:hypothetical protein